MKALFKIPFYLFCIILLFDGCTSTNPTEEKKAIIDKKLEIKAGTVSFNPNNFNNEDIVFYNIFSPVDLTYLVNQQETFYNSSLLNPINNIIRYNESTSIALNLGVYGADISYLWMFKQHQQALSYRAAIQRLTDKLEIPRDFVNFTYSNAESNSQNFDSLVYIARISYKKTDDYLIKTGRKHSASLVLLGGWIETLYIATHIYDKPEPKLLGKIAIQKYSLNSLISLLQLSQEELNISEYLLLLRKLKKAFDTLEVQFPPESLVIDTSLKHIKLINYENLNLSAEDFSDIKRITRQIRNHIIQ